MPKTYKDRPCPHCGNFTNRGVSVDAVIIKNGKILLIKRGVEPFKDYWGTPGGYVSWDENAEDTVKREVKEETGLSVLSMNFIKVATSPDRHPKQVINLVYLVDAEGKLSAGDDAVQCKWFDLNNLPEKLAFDHRENIERAVEYVESN
jgi:8-oxo-dGTP diphosphatase